MLIQVQRKMCSTCIYRPRNQDSLKRLEDQIRDPKMRGFFVGFRACHHAPKESGVCCAGFWKRHKNDFTLGQLAQRLGEVEKVDIDVCTRCQRT